MLSFDTTYAPETPQDFRRLLEAIHTASPEDETDWLEWKSHLDLSQRKDRFILAKTVLGMANRQPEIAEQYCEGFGYIVVGIEPANQPGVSRIDPAEMTDFLEPYLGVDALRWNHQFIKHSGRDVLIVSVDPPRQGDQIFCLMKTYERHREGTIYVRKTGKTEPAKPPDIRNLEDRACRGRLDIRLDVTDATPLPWVDTDELIVMIDNIVEKYRNKLLQPIDNQRTQTRPDSLLAQADRTRASLRGIARAMENRSESDYREQVETWATDWRRDAEDVAITWCAENGGAVRRLRVSNLTPQNLQELQVELFLPKCLIGPAEELSHSELPEPPALYGTGYLAALAQPLPVAFPYLGSRVEDDPLDMWVEESDHDVKLIWDVGDVRPYATHESSDIYLIFESQASLDVETSKWHSTAKNIDGRGRGELTLQVSEDAVDLGALAEHLEHQTTDREPR